MDLNRVMLIGRLARDPEVRTTTSGQSVATLTVVTNFTWTDQSGAKQERPEFHNCVLWRRLAEIAGQYLSKGRRVYLEGRLQTRDWVGQDGVKRYRTEIVGESMIMLDGPRGAAPAAGETAEAPFEDMAAAGPSAGPVEPPSTQEVRVEDIPF